MARTALRRTAAALLLALLAGFASALTYVPDPDDPILPAEERVARLERRSERLATLASEIRRDGESIGQLAAEGKLLEAGLKEKLATFQSARATDTVKLAAGETGKHGLRWLCERATRLHPRIAALAGEVAAGSRSYLAMLAKTPAGSDGSADASSAAVTDLQSSLRESIDRAQPEPLRADLVQLDQGLAFAWGAFTTLRLIAASAEEQTRQLGALGQRLDDAAARLDKPIATFSAERDDILRLTDTLARHMATQTSLQKRIAAVRSKVERVFAGPIRQLQANSYRESATQWRERWQPMAKQASAEVYAAIKPLHQAAETCGDADDPPRHFANARGAAARTMLQAVAAIESAGSARIATLEAELRTLDKALASWQHVMQQALDKSSAAWRQMEAAVPGSVGQRELRQQFDRLSEQKKKAQTAVEAIPQAQAAARRELDALRRQLPALSSQLQLLRTVFPKDST